jgi:hypothetical protein
MWYEYLGIIIAVIVVAFFILPTNKRPKGCICKWGMMGPLVKEDCPVHKGWAEPLYPQEEIIAAGKPEGEREKAAHEAGLHVNRLLKKKWHIK